jgi:hypothetical protein
MPTLTTRSVAHGVLAVLLGSALIIGVVRAQTPAEPDPPAAPDFHHHGGLWGAVPGLRMAERLATLEVYLGITPQQQDAWRVFTQAALAMAPSPGERHGDAGAGAFEGIDHMAARLQHVADAAQKFDQAAQALKAVLTPEQIQKADLAWATLREMREHHWHHQT